MHKQTKHLNISRFTRKAVYERDDCRCLWCGGPGFAEAHYIPRSLGGLGIEQNVLTLCRKCHHDFDRGPDRQRMKVFFAAYLRSKYDGWTEEALYYKKENFDA